MAKIDRTTLESIFDAAWEGEELPQHAEHRDRFVFHLLDALPDIVKLADLLESQKGVSAEVLGPSLYDFFLHTVPHLVAAGQLYDVIPETFPEQRGDSPSERCKPSPSTSR